MGTRMLSAFLVVLLGLAAPAMAAGPVKKVALKVDGMTCPT